VSLNEKENGIETGVVEKDIDISKFVEVKKNERKKINYKRLVKISDQKTAGVKFFGKVQGTYEIEYFTEDGKTFKAFSGVFKDNVDNQLLASEVNSEVYRDIYNVR
jgi:hypothetical protein